MVTICKLVMRKKMLFGDLYFNYRYFFYFFMFFLVRLVNLY